MKVLISGACGRLGPYVLKELTAAGHEPVLFSRRQPEAEFSKYELVKGDLNNLEDCRHAAAAEKFDAVLHLAAQPWPTDHPKQLKRAREAGLPADQAMRTNILGTYNLLHAAMENKIGIFVMTGSNCAAGLTFRLSGRPFQLQYLPLDEKHPTDVEDSYSFSKLVDEELTAMYTRAYGMRTYVLRSAGISNEEGRRRMAENAKPADGWRASLCSWIGFEDAASAHRLVMEKAREIEPHDVFFLNANDSTYLEPTKEVIERWKPELLSSLKEELPGHASLISNRKLREAVGWEPKTSWREHLK